MIKKLIITLLIFNSYATPYKECFIMAGIYYQIPPDLLYVIAKTETNLNPHSININKNKTYDIGIMQINSSWLKKLQKAGITPKDLINPCLNIQIGAWILKDNIKRYGLNLKAIGAYNSQNPYYQKIYTLKVFNEYLKQKRNHLLLSLRD